MKFKVTIETNGHATFTYEVHEDSITEAIAAAVLWHNQREGLGKVTARDVLSAVAWA